MSDISIIIPVYNGEKWINDCMNSILKQSLLNDSKIKIEVVVYNDGSTDNTLELLMKWEQIFKTKDVSYKILGGNISNGVGAAKNRAVGISTGQFLCFQDIDDVMNPLRINLQWEAAKSNLNALIGSNIVRRPENSTPRYVRWANSLTANQLKLQIYTSFGPTLLMPTWFCHRSVYDKVGGFVETGHGTPEDLIFFYKHLDAGGDLIKLDQALVVYVYHEDAATFSVKREMIWKIQLERLQNCVIPSWKEFTIWNAGKRGRKVVRSLNTNNLNKIVAFCDIDKNKIGHDVELYCPIKRKVIVKLPVLHFTEAKPPLLICVKLDLTAGEFEKNLSSLNLIEGTDYVLFS